MTRNIPPTTTSPPPLSRDELVGYTPVYAPRNPEPSPSPVVRDTLASHLNGVCICVVVMVLGGWIGWSLSDSHLGGVNIRAVKAAQVEAEQSLAIEQERTNQARRALGCITP